MSSVWWPLPFEGEGGEASFFAFFALFWDEVADEGWAATEAEGIQAATGGDSDAGDGVVGVLSAGLSKHFKHSSSLLLDFSSEASLSPFFAKSRMGLVKIASCEVNKIFTRSA